MTDMIIRSIITTYFNWAIGQRVTKKSGSSWTGFIVGFYFTEKTHEGYAVESETEKGSVQIYPKSALKLAPIDSKLKPCPFCGGEARTRDCFDHYLTECTECQVFTSGCGKNSRQLSIDEWNTRTESKDAIAKFVSRQEPLGRGFEKALDGVEYEVDTKVKQLEWSGEFGLDADTPFCNYALCEHIENGTWCYHRSEYPFHNESDYFQDKESARAAAQADYKTRVKACLVGVK